MNSVSPPPSRRAAWLWTIAKWALCLVVLSFVAGRAAELWDADELRRVRFSAGWLVLAGVAYLAGWLPAVWFWGQLLRRLDGAVGFVDAARAYYCGHLGKYIPGKASVLVIRSGLLKGRGSPVTVSALTATYETLFTMGAGLAVAAALSPILLSEATTSRWPFRVRQILTTPGLPMVVVLAVCVLLLPVLSELLTYIAVRMTPRGMLGGEQSVRIGKRLLGAGLLALAGGWALHGLSLGLTLRAVGTPLDLTEWPAWTGAVSLSTVVGFLAIFAPGGIGVREGLLIETLQAQPQISAQQAVAAAVFLRVVWLAAEVFAAAALFYGASGRRIAAEALVGDDGR